MTEQENKKQPEQQKKAEDETKAKPEERRYAVKLPTPMMSADRIRPLPIALDGAMLAKCTVALLALGLSQTDCLPVRPEDPALAAVEVLGLRPSSDVGPTDPVSIALSEPVSSAQGRWPITVRAEQGVLAPEVSLAAGGVDIVLTPREPWPPGQRISVELGTGLLDQSGRVVVVPSDPLIFETMVEPLHAPEVGLRYPPLGRDVPLNLRWIALTSSGFDPPPRFVALERDTQRISAEVMRVGAGGLLLARLPQHHAACDPLCPDTKYSIAVEGDATGSPSARGAIHTATIADAIAPTVTATRVVFDGDRVTLEVEASEPVLLGARMIAGDGTETPIELPLVAAACVFVEPGPEMLEPELDYTFIVEGEDIAGNALPRLEVALRTPPRVEVEINELVPSPFHDWNDSDGIGSAFDARPGAGAVTDSDEWIELVNRSDAPIDLGTAGLVLRTRDTSPTETVLSSVSPIYFGDGGSRLAWWPGEAIVFHPRGSIAQRGFTLELASGTRTLDRVVVGDAEDAVALSGGPPSLEHEALARDASGRFRWCAPSPGDPLPAEDCDP